MGMERVSIGMIGAQFAARLHLNGLSKLRGTKVEVAAVASRHIDHAESFTKDYGIPDYYDDYRRLLERKDIDIVDLCIPPSPDDDWIRGYTQEMEDFVDAVLLDREPVSGIRLARDVVEVIHAAYLSAEQGRRIELQ